MIKRTPLQKRLPEKAGRGLWFLLKGYKPVFFSAFFFQGIAVAAGTAGYFLLRFYIDEIIITGNWTIPIIYISLGYIGFALIRGLFSFLAARGTAAASEGIVKGIRNALFDHTQKLSFSYHDKTRTGELIQKSTSDVDSVRRFYSEMSTGFSRILFLFIINFTSIMYLNLKLGLLSIVAVPVIAGLSIIFFSRIFKAYKAYQEQDGRISSTVQENLTGVRIVRAFARQQFENEKFETENKEKFNRGKKFLFNHALYWPTSQIICAGQLIAGISIGVFMVFKGTLSVGDLVAYLGLLNAIIWPIQQLGRIIAQLSTAWVSYGRIASILQNDQEDLKGGTSPDSLKGEIEFNNIHFQYETDVPVLKNINFKCRQGEVIALLGETGSGKTSLVNLLPGFYKHTGGELLLDGTPIQNFPLHFLREHIGIVEQEPFLFSTTIRNNISYGVKRDITEEEIIKAAEAASIHKSILSFTEKYDTMVGEKGVTLSGGQKQRIVIARTILKDPEILILDDSTSSVDAETEEEIRNALDKLMRGRTTFIVAHRIQSLVNADTILVFKEGEIIQKGTHDELIRQEGFYSRVFQLQNSIEIELEKEMTRG